MNKYVTETNTKITIVGFILIGVIFLGNMGKELKDFNLNDLSKLTIKENESKNKLI
jgi:hypothetical protein